jgi:hypothetical protein
MLALSASDLILSQPFHPELPSVAMTHRVKAIRALNSAIGKPLLSFAEGNAMLATCYALLFQSVLMRDGLVEYMTFIRGVIVVALHMGKRNMRFLFRWMVSQVEGIDHNLERARLTIRTWCVGRVALSRLWRR